MRLIAQHPTRQSLEISPEKRQDLSAYLTEEIEDAFSSRNALDSLFLDLMRQYEGVPKNPTRNVPIENAPNIEITLGAIAADSIYAQMIDLVFTASPLITVRATNASFVEHAKALQRFVEIIVPQSNLRSAADHTALDDVQLGTGVYYVPFVENIKKTRSSKIIERRPHIYPHPIEDLIIPGGEYEDLQQMAWVGLRFWMTQNMLNHRAKARKWDVSGFKQSGNKDWVRSRRETLGKTHLNPKRQAPLFEIIDTYVYFDIDDDGIDEDLYVVFDRTSRSIGYAAYNPFDHRPIESARYQLRSHLFHGIGVLEMIRPFQEETTEIHNARTLNMFLANARIWKAREGSVSETMKLWPNKVVLLSDPDDLQAEQMGDIYQSAPQAQAITTALAERRVGVNELSMPRPSQVLGSRTPGITALSLLQQVNRRFTPAFDGFRFATSAAVKQCLYRYQERLLAGDTDIENFIKEVLDGTDQASTEGRAVVELLRDEDFDNAIAVELTSASASINRDADRQNAIMLVNILATYYQRTLELVSIAANPQTPEQVREVAKKIANSAGEIIERTIRTFDQVRDPEAFIVDVNEELDQIQGLSQQGLLGLAQLFQGITATAAGGEGSAGFPPVGTA